MGFSLNKRLLSLLTLLCFAAGISYHHLCDAQIFECSPCQVETGHTEPTDGCKTCEQSAKLSKSAQFSKQADAALACVFLAVIVVDHIIFTPPQHIVLAAEPPPTELLLAFILRDIKQSIPIRGPSITA